MTSWPWMRNIPVAIADPISPVNERDDRLSVKDLIEINQQRISEIKRHLLEDPLYDAKKHDELWILRFLLSHKNKTRDAVKAAQRTLQFRHKHKLDERDIRYQPPLPASATSTSSSAAAASPEEDCKKEAFQRFSQFLEEDALRCVVPDPNRGVVCFMRVTGYDLRGLVDNIEESDWLLTHCYISEWCHQWLDYVTRTTGRLTKAIRFVDLKGLSLFGANHDFIRRNSKFMRVIEDYYPQLLQSVFVCHSPVWVEIPWQVVRLVFPKRSTEKFHFIHPYKNERERKHLLYKYISEDNLPTRYGGTYESWPVDHPLPS